MMTKETITILGYAFWMMGLVIAKGAWSTLFAICIPFYAWYLSAEFFFHKFLA